MEANGDYKTLLQTNEDFADLVKDFTTEHESESDDEIVSLSEM